MEYQDYYAVLGVPRTASQSEIKKAFRKLARTHHPDRNPGDATAERRFKQINEANAVLSDPDKRALFDRLGADRDAYSRAGATAGAGAGGARGAAAHGWAGGTGGAGGPFSGFATGQGGGNVRYEFHSSDEGGDFSDFFQAFFGGASEPVGGTADGPGRGRRATGGPRFEDIMAGLGLDPSGSNGAAGAGRRGPAGVGAAAGTTRAASRQPSAEAVAEITLDEAYHGTKRLIDLDGKRLEVTIPAGADTGSRIRLTGKAPGGGDLHVVVRQLPDATFTRRGADLERELPLTLEEALLGGDVTIGTPKGKVVLTIPPSTQHGRTFRLTGQGLPRFKGDGRGDLYVKARLVLPTELSEDARLAARRFFEIASQPDPRKRET